MAALLIGGAAFLRSQADDGQSVTAPASAPAASDSPTYFVIVTTPETVFYVNLDGDNPRVFSAQPMVDAEDSVLAAVREAATGALSEGRAKSYWPQAVDIEGVEEGRDFDIDESIRITLSAPAELPSGVTPEQARSQVAAIVKTAQAAYTEYAEHDGELEASPAMHVAFFVGHEHQDAVLGVPESVFDTGVDPAY